MQSTNRILFEIRNPIQPIHATITSIQLLHICRIGTDARDDTRIGEVRALSDGCRDLEAGLDAAWTSRAAHTISIRR